NVVGLAIEGNRARPVHGLQVLLNRELGGAQLLHDGERPISLSAEGFFGGRVEDGAVGAAGDGQLVEDLAGGRVQNDHRLRRRGRRGRGSGSGLTRLRARRRRTLGAASGKQNMVLGVQSQAVTAAILAEGV